MRRSTDDDPGEHVVHRNRQAENPDLRRIPETVEQDGGSKEEPQGSIVSACVAQEIVGRHDDRKVAGLGPRGKNLAGMETKFHPALRSTAKLEEVSPQAETQAPPPHRPAFGEAPPPAAPDSVDENLLEAKARPAGILKYGPVSILDPMLKQFNQAADQIGLKVGMSYTAVLQAASGGQFFAKCGLPGLKCVSEIWIIRIAPRTDRPRDRAFRKRPANTRRRASRRRGRPGN